MQERFIFPRWSNKVLPIVFFLVLGPAATAAVGGVWYYGTDKFLSVGYQPDPIGYYNVEGKGEESRPARIGVEYSHKLHAGDLGLDCRYCHSTVERSAFAAVPPTETCMNCHWKVRTESPKTLPIRLSFSEDKPIEWVRVHNLPDFVYFNHSAHLASGVGCASCHGRVDQMPKMTQMMPLTMGWCLECHRDPGPHIRDPKDVTKMDWSPPPNAPKAGEKVVATNGRVLNPPQFCSGCHR